VALDPAALILTVLAVAFVAFVLSAAAGMGGSLILVPALALVIGTKEGIALAALLLAANNVVKVAAYRATLPFRQALALLVALAAGSALGAVVMIRAPEALIATGVIVILLMTLAAERRGWNPHAPIAAPGLAFSAGVTSGVSGTSGPLKGVALRQLSLDRAHFVGAASLASLVGDVTKVGVFASDSLLAADSFTVAALAIPLMLVGTALGRQVNRRVGEAGFAVIFWVVMGGYGVRLVAFSV
jgi:uncharacterized protein